MDCLLTTMKIIKDMDNFLLFKDNYWITFNKTE